jgi:hypothetical protein
MTKDDDVKSLLEKVEKATKEKKLDLSSDEDLSIGVMNLIGLEEHLFFTAQKTGNDKYYELLHEVREMRKVMLKKIIKEYEGEVWCASKHVLSASMRMMEVGTKALTKGDKKDAKEFFDASYNLYAMFWALNMGQIKGDGKITKAIMESFHEEGYSTAKILPSEDGKPGFMGKMREFLKKAIDCCKE